MTSKTVSRKPDAIKVLIVEDHQMVAEMTTRILESESDIRVVGWAKTVAAAHAAVAEMAPDVILMDYQLPDGDGISAAAMIRKAHPSIRVVLLTGSEHDGLFTEALNAGFSGYISKTEGVAHIATAVRAAHAGSTAISPEMLAIMLRAATKPRQNAGSDALSARELHVLRLLSGGLRTEAIAQRLSLSPNTVRNHVQSILEKLDAHSKLEAVTKAIRLGLVKPNDR